MAIQRTFSIIKPDATNRNLTGAINAKIEAAGLRIVAQKRVHMTRSQAETFYGVHAGKPFFDELVVEYGYDRKNIKLIEALLFLTMIPLHSDDIKRQQAFYLTAIKKLNEVLYDGE